MRLMMNVFSERAGRLVFLCLWLTLHSFCRTSFLNDPGSFSHTMYGETMLQQGSLIRTDQFTCSRYGQPWIAQQWLGEVIMALLGRIGGFDALLLAATLLVSLLFTGIWIRIYNSGMHFLLTVLLLFLAISSSSMQFLVRPLLFTMAALAWLFSLLIDLEAGRRPVFHLCFSIPVFWIWANTHGGYLGGIGTLGLCVSGWTGLRLAGYPSPLKSTKDVLFAWTMVVLAIAMSILGPYGIELPRTWAKIVESPLLKEIIIEHRPLYHHPLSILPMLLMALYSFFLVRFSNRPIRLSWLIPLVWFVLAWERLRHVPLFGITAALGFADMYQNSTRLDALAVSKPLYARTDGRPSPRLPIRTALAIFVIGLWLQASGSSLPFLGAGWAKPDHSRWPMELIPTMREFAARKGSGKSVFTEFNLGSWAVGIDARLRVTMDDRCELFGDALLREHHESEKNTCLIASWVRTYAPAAALTRPGSPFDAWFQTTPGWKVIASAPAGIWYETTGSGSTMP